MLPNTPKRAGTSAQGKAETDAPVQSEKMLMEMIERIGRARSEYGALRLHLSELQPYNRSPSYLRIAGYMATRMSRSAGAESFQLPNDDIVIIGKNVAFADLENIVTTVRALFARDPLSFSDFGDGQDKFCTTYDFAQTFDAFKNDISDILRARVSTNEEWKKSGSPRLDPETLERVVDMISHLDLSPVIRRQTALRFLPQEGSRVAFEEYFVSMADLPDAITFESNLISSRWLFLYLSASLDHTMLEWLSDVRLQRRRAPLSLNLNIESLFTPLFRGLEDRLRAAGQALVVELQMPDVFADLGAYFFARDWLHERGHQVLIDGVRDTTLDLTNIALLKTDLIKLLWTPRLTDARHGAATSDLIKALDPDSIVLAHCDSEQAIRWGDSAGISCFQGNFIDTMLAAVTMQRCDGKEGCTLQECEMRRRLLGGQARLACVNHIMLDSLPVLKRPKAIRTSDSGTSGTKAGE